MAERTIKHRVFHYRTVEDDPNRPGNEVYVEHAVSRGATVDIPLDVDINRGEKFGAFYTDEELNAQATAADTTGVEALDLDATVEWLESDEPTVDEVLEKSQGDPTRARVLLEAEDQATGGNPRKGVQDGLAKVIGEGSPEE